MTETELRLIAALAIIGLSIVGVVLMLGSGTVSRMPDSAQLPRGTTQLAVLGIWQAGAVLDSLLVDALARRVDAAGEVHDGADLELGQLLGGSRQREMHRLELGGSGQIFAPLLPLPVFHGEKIPAGR